MPRVRGYAPSKAVMKMIGTAVAMVLVAGAANAQATVQWDSAGVHECSGPSVFANAPSIRSSGWVTWRPLYRNWDTGRAYWGQDRIAYRNGSWMFPSTRITS